MGGDTKGFRRYVGLTFLIGFGFFTMGLMDILYDSYVPIFLGRYIRSNSLIGSIMTLDNILAIVLIPFVSHWSDNARTRMGRRLPFIVVLLPLTALCFGAIPYAAFSSLGALVAVIFALNLWKQSARGPVVALMPDTIPGEFRSEANGVINTMGALGSIISTVGLARLMTLDLRLPILGQTKDRLPFPVAGLFVILATLLLFLFVREKDRAAEDSGERVPFLRSIRAIASEKDQSALWILLSILFWFMGYQGILPFIAKLSREIFQVSMSNATLPAAAVGVAQALFAIPAGFVAHRIGRRKAIRIALVAIAVLFSVCAAVVSEAGAPLGQGTRFALFLGSLFVLGVFWITIVTNSFPMLWQMASYGTMGVYTGLYYTFSQTAAIASPPVTGAIIDLAGYAGIFVFAAACMLVAFFLMGKVRRGEPHEDAAVASTAG